MKLIIGKKRKDNKYPVQFIYSGQPNGFGGLTCGKVFNKILSREKAVDALNKAIKLNDAYTAPEELLPILDR